MDNAFSELKGQFRRWEISNRVSKSSSGKIEEIFEKIIKDGMFELKDICASYKPSGRHPENLQEYNLKVKELIVPSEFDLIFDSGYERQCANTCIRDITICDKENLEVKINIHFCHYFDDSVSFIAYQNGIKYEYYNPSNRFLCLKTAVKISSTGTTPCIYNGSYSFDESEIRKLIPVAEKYYICFENDDSLRYKNNKDIISLMEKNLLPEFNQLIQAEKVQEEESGRVVILITNKNSCFVNAYVKYKDLEGKLKPIGTLTNLPITEYSIDIKFYPKGFDTPINVGKYCFRDLINPDINIADLIESTKIYYRGE